MKLIGWLGLVATFLGGLVMGMAYIFTTFATSSYVDKSVQGSMKYTDDKHAEAIAHSDANRASMAGEITGLKALMVEIKDTVKTIETRTWESQRGPHKM